MKPFTEKLVTIPKVSDEREEEIRFEIVDLVERERKVMEILVKAQKELLRIQEEHQDIMKELLDGDIVQPNYLELSPNMADEAIASLKTEFYKTPKDQKQAGYKVQEGMDFTAVEKKLRSEENEEKLKALYRMVKAHSRPAVVCEEDGCFCIAETFGQTLSNRANCVYDRKAEKQVGREKCNGNAVTQSQKMGVPLMERHIAEAHMEAFPNEKQYCCDYIKATPEELKSGKAPRLERDDWEVIVNVDFSYKLAGFCGGGWRGEIWV